MMEDQEAQKVKVLYPFSHDNVVMQEGEQLVVIKKTNADWWQVTRLEESAADSAPFYAPTPYLEIVDTRHVKPDIKTRTRPPLSLTSNNTSQQPSLKLGLPESKSDDNLLTKVASSDLSRQRSTSMDAVTFRDQLSSLGITKLAVEQEKHKKTRLSKDIWDRRKSWAIEPCITTIPPPPEFAKEDWASAPSAQRFSYSEPSAECVANILPRPPPKLLKTLEAHDNFTDTIATESTINPTGSGSPTASSVKTISDKLFSVLPPRPPPRQASRLFLQEVDKANLISPDKADKAPALPPKGRLNVLTQPEQVPLNQTSPVSPALSPTTPFITPDSSPGSGPTPPRASHYSKVVPLPRTEKPRLAPRVKHLSESLERLAQQIPKAPMSVTGALVPAAPDLPPKPGKIRYENLPTFPRLPTADLPLEEATNLSFNNPLYTPDREDTDQPTSTHVLSPAALYRNTDFFKESFSASSDDNLGSKDSLDSLVSSSDKSLDILDEEQNKQKFSPGKNAAAVGDAPPSPSPNCAPRRFLPDGWLEHSLASGRPYYYHPTTGSKSWKPPRRNTPLPSTSISNLKDKLGMNDRDGRARAYSADEDGIQPELPLFSSFHYSVKGREPRKPASASEKVAKEATQSRKTQSSKTRTSKYSLPTGWVKSWDVEAEEVCYVNSSTGAKWYSSLDNEGRVYFFEENSNESVWTLPEVPTGEAKMKTDNTPTFTYPLVEQNLLLLTPPPTEKASVPTITVPEEPSAIAPISTPANTRTLAGSRSERNIKARSMVLTPFSGTTEDVENANIKPSNYTLPMSAVPPIGWTGSLPRGSTMGGQWPSFQAGAINVIHQGVLYKTKITDQGRKVRKNWSSSFVVLTDLLLLLVKDAKAATQVRTGNVANMPELCVDLKGAVLEWACDRSSRKNVFQISTVLGQQLLLQDDDVTKSKEWFEKIRLVIQQLPSSQVTGAGSVPPSPSKPISPTFLTPPTPEEPKRFGRLVRTKSTKVRILGSTEDLTAAMPADRQNKLRDKLKKFFVRRPNLDTLMKKGIYKDEPVFGCRLQNLCAVEQSIVPCFVKQVIAVIEGQPENMKADGLYRASGNLSQVQKIRLQVDQDKWGVLEEEEDVHVLTGALKLFFRELKEPLISHALFAKALQASNLTVKNEKTARFKEIVEMLPKENYETLKFLLGHLLNVTEYREHNRMHISNLAIVFGPTLMWPLAETTNLALDMMQQNLVVEALLTQYADIFKSKS